MSQMTHTLHIGEEAFDIKHNNKRLYKFINWNEARESLIRIILSKLKESHDIDDAYIDFTMANPMRRSRLGNFYIAIDAKVIVRGQGTLGTLEDLGLANILVEDYITHDEDEISLREDVEVRYSSEQYNKEYLLRKKSLEELMKNEVISIKVSGSESNDLDGMITKLLSLEGWSDKNDNRLPARIKRLPKCMDLSS